MRALMKLSGLVLLSLVCGAAVCGDEQGPGEACQDPEPFDGTFTTDTTMDGCYLVTGHISVTQGVTLTIAPGSVLKFEEDRVLEVTEGGTLVAAGTKDSPIRFTGAVEKPGYWRGIELHNTTSKQNVLDHVVVEYAGGYTFAQGDRADIAVTSSGAPTRLKLSNSTIRNSGGWGLYVSGNAVLPGFSGNSITKNSLGAAKVGAEAVSQLDTGTSYSGNTVDRVWVDGATLETDQTWQAIDVPYVIDSTVHLTRTTGVKLTIAAGATLKFNSNGGIEVADGGALTAAGQGGAKITFTRANPGEHWRGLHFHNANASGNRLTHVVVEYGGGYSFASGAPANVAITSTGYPVQLTLESSTVRNSAGYGVWVDSNAAFTEQDNTYSDNALTPDVFYEQ